METAAPSGQLSRPAKFVEKYKEQGWTDGQVRWLIFQSKQNGLDDAGAIVRVGRRVFIDEPKWFAWMRTNRASA